MKKCSLILSTAFAFVISSAHAADLMTVYHQALLSNPQFEQEQAQYLSARENFNLALTGPGSQGTGVFPYIDLNGDIGKNFQTAASSPDDGTTVESGLFNEDDVNVVFDEPLFNAATWKAIEGARYTVRAATATYLSQAQQLMQTVSTAYFAVLRANDTLMLTLAQKEQFKHQLITEEQKFKVGLIAITGVYDAKASYDRSIADEVDNRNKLHNQLENLRAITGRFYSKLKGLKPDIPLVIPRPENIEAWVQIANKQNYLLQADINNMLAAHKALQQAKVSWWPTLDLQLLYSRNTNGNLFGGVTTTLTTQKTIQAAVNFPVFRGGYDIINSRQARYNYLAVSDQLEIDHRNVVNNTRQAYLGVDSGISQIRADEQAILSARNQLAATRAGYIVGTRTMVDVLDSVTKLTQAQQAYADDRYTYVLSIILLKEEAGILSPRDLEQINGWLGNPIKFDLKQPKITESSGFDYKTIHYKRAHPTELLKINNPRDTSPTTPEGKPVESIPTIPIEPFKKTTPTPEIPKMESHFQVPLKKSNSSALRMQHLSEVLGQHPTYKLLPKPAAHHVLAQPNATLLPPRKTAMMLHLQSPALTDLHSVAEKMGLPVSSEVAPQKSTPHYSIVLLSDRSPFVVRDFIKTNHLASAARVVLVDQGKLTGFNRVLFGQYASYAAAKKGIQDLPQKLRLDHPWIISIK